jgi:CBS domain-containing protein
MNMRANELMTRSPKTCEPDHDLTCALRIMKEENCGIVPVTKGNGAARVVGVVTDRDIALHLGSLDAKPSQVKIADVMTTELVSCAPSADAHEVSRKMQQAQVRRILVIQEGRLEGVISTADLARASAKSGKELGDEVEQVIEKVSEESRSRPRV